MVIVGSKKGRHLMRRSMGQFKRYKGRLSLGSTDKRAPAFKILQNTENLINRFPKKKQMILNARSRMLKATTLTKQNKILSNLLPKLRKR